MSDVIIIVANSNGKVERLQNSQAKEPLLARSRVDSLAQHDLNLWYWWPYLGSLLDNGFQKEIGAQLESIIEDQNFGTTILTFLMKLCGLRYYVEDLNENDLVQSIKHVLKRTEKNSRHVRGAIVPPALGENQEFRDACSDFWEHILFDDASDFIMATDILKEAVGWLTELSNSKVRAIRTASLEVMSQILQKALPYCATPGASVSRVRLAKKLVVNLNEIVKLRIRDVDPSIRRRACDLLVSVYEGLGEEIVSTS